jgi:hypothetical protein
VNGRNAPLFLATDIADELVEQYDAPPAKVRAGGGPIEAHYYRGLSHGLLCRAAAWPWPLNAEQ